MKRILNIIGFFTLCAMFGACQGTEGELELLLNADRQSILADGSEAVTFSVMLGSEDVTSEAEITCINDGTVLESNTFSTTVAGSYSFMAKYGEYESVPAAVTATKKDSGGSEDGSDGEPSKYNRKICVMEFTGQWCSQCPSGLRTLLINLNRSEFKGKTHLLALHDNSSGIDEFALPVQLEMFREYKLTGYPSVVINMKDKVAIASSSSGLYDYLMEPLKEGPHCGVAVSSAYDQAAGKAKVTVKVTSEKDAKYRLAVWVVENYLEGPQKDGEVEIPDYEHHHVARQLVSGSYKGDSLGEIAKDAEVSKTYEIPADPAWTPENVSVYAIVIDSEGIVNNMAACDFVDGNTDYDLADTEKE